MDPLLVALISVLIGGLMVALGIWALPKLKHEKQGYPLEVQVERALLPFAFQGICAAYRISEMAVDALGGRLRGLEKQEVANVIYDLLPDTISGIPLEIVKAVVSRERFAELVQDAFSRFDAGYTQFEGKYIEAFDEWVKEYQAVE